jgi:Arc/MetJ-type ribon-helix-helix transcriptional regulator
VNTKARLSASVDADLIAAAEAAVDAGRSGSVSAWVNEALRLKREQDQRLQALGAFVAAYEAEHGAIVPEDIQAAERRARARAVVVRPAAPAATLRKHRRVAGRARS